MNAMPHQTAASNAGEPSERAMPAGVRKMPREIASPVTTAVAAQTPICGPVWRSLPIVRISYRTAVVAEHPPMGGERCRARLRGLRHALTSRCIPATWCIVQCVWLP